MNIELIALVLDDVMYLVEGDVLRIREGSKSVVTVVCSDSEVIFVASLELGEGAGHRKRKSLHVPDLLPEAGVGDLGPGLLVSVQLVGHNSGVSLGEGQVPRQHYDRTLSVNFERRFG